MDEIKCKPGTLDQGISSASADLACEYDVGVDDEAYAEFENFKESVNEFATAVSDGLSITTEDASIALYQSIEQFLIDKCIEAVCAQNPSWYHYALHAKKARIRKKYINKILNKAKYFARLYINEYYKGESK